jgi:outer membrane scaffolding protein for murein synthesis (MipA/OmpV family)
LICIHAMPLAAQTPSPIATWQYSPGLVLAPLFGHPLPTWSIVLGVGAEVEPQYTGSQRYVLNPGPTIDVRYRDQFFFSTGEGLGANLLRGSHYRAGAAISYDRGRDQDLNLRLRGLGDVSPAPELKLFAEYAILPFVLRADLRRGLGGHDGYIGEVATYLPIAGSEHFHWFVGPSVELADSRYMSAYFGISPEQSARSGYRRFTADGGIKSIKFGTTAGYNFTEHWLVECDAAVQRLLGDAARSPVTEEKAQFLVAITLGYQF